jgi:23S rRNA pseudouridine1911/1915/1917 synthase
MKTGRKPGSERVSTFKVNKESTLFDFLQQAFKEKSKTSIKQLLTNKLVQVDNQFQTHVSFAVKPGNTVVVGKKEQKQVKLPFHLNVLFEDDHLMAVVKPEGLLCNATDKEKLKTLSTYVSAQFKAKNPGKLLYLVNRLDRDTSGIVIFAKSMDVKTIMVNAWGETMKNSSYLAIVEGVVKPKDGEITSYLRESKAMKVHASKNQTYGKEAITEYVTVGNRKNSSMLEIAQRTNIKNQIRVQLQEIGHPIVGDKKYGAKTNPIGRLGLHFYRVEFVHPITKKVVEIKSKAPRGFINYEL